MRPFMRVVAFAIFLAALPPAFAQAWPNRPIKFIIPYPPGGQTDIVTRWLADRLTPVLGQPVVPENRAGAQGSVGLQVAKSALPDGYTFVYTNVSNISINPHIQANLPYDGLKDFATVTQLGLSVLAMVVPTSLNVKTLPEFIDYTKKNPGKVSFASFGNGSSSHVYGEMLKGAAGIDMIHVAYKGAGPAVQDIIAGHAQMGIHDLASVAAGLSGNRLVALAVTGPKRWPALPNLPTFAEQGYPLDIAGWNGIQAPAGTPKPILDRLSAEINRIIQSPEGREQILKFGLLVTGTTPEEFAEIIRRDTPRWGTVIRGAGIKGD